MKRSRPCQRTNNNKKNKKKEKKKRKEKSVPGWVQCFWSVMVGGVSINQSIKHSVSLLGRAEIVLKRQMLKKKKKKKKKNESNHSLGFLYLWSGVEKSCLFSCGHESKRDVSLLWL